MTTLLMMLMSAALAQEADVPTVPRPSPESIEAVLRGPQNQRPIPPSGRDLAGTLNTMEKLRAHLLEKSRLWPEGHTLALRRGRLEEDLSPRFVFTDTADEPLTVLANAKLDQMQNYVEAAGGRDVEFRIIGSVTEFRGQNYLLLREVNM